MRFSAAFIVLALFCAPAFADPGAGEVHAGNAFYRKGEFQHAIQHYEKAAEKNPADARIEYNIGAAAYEAKDYDAAIDHFQKSLLTDDNKFRRDVYFDLGDAFYRVGINREDKDIDQSIKRLESSLSNFEKARKLDPKDKQAVENYEFVKKILDQYKQKKQQQDQQKQQQKQDQQKQDQQKQDQQKQDQQKQDQQKQDQQKQDQQKQDQQKQDQQKQDQQKPEDQKSQDQKDQEKKDQEKKDQEKQDQQKQDQQKQDQEKKDQEKQDQQKKDQEQKDQQNKPNDQNNPASGQTAEGQISSQKDANNMVDNFERNEMPKGLLNFIHKTGEARPVEKDW